MMHYKTKIHIRYLKHKSTAKNHIEFPYTFYYIVGNMGLPSFMFFAFMVKKTCFLVKKKKIYKIKFRKFSQPKKQKTHSTLKCRQKCNHQLPLLNLPSHSSPFFLRIFHLSILLIYLIFPL